MGVLISGHPVVPVFLCHGLVKKSDTGPAAQRRSGGYGTVRLIARLEMV